MIRCIAAIMFLLGTSVHAVWADAVSPLQKLVDSSAPGDTLRIPGGEYYGNVVIDRRLTLQGEGMPLLYGAGRGSVVTITADSVTVCGFRIEHCGTMLVEENSGILIKSSHNRLVGNELRDILFGIYLFNSNDNEVCHNLIVGRRELGVGERGAGIHIWSSHRNTFVGNRITDARDGFYIQYANHMRIEQNEVWNVRYGLHYMYADTNVFIGNSFHDNVAGAAIMYSRHIIMRRNMFLHNRGFSSYGALFQDCHYSVADSNVFADNVMGLFFEASTHNLFTHNTIALNDAAIQMFQNSTDNTFSRNNFIDNLNPLLLVGKSPGTHWSMDGIGNYWSSYNGYDMDGDGIGDVAMKIQNVFEYIEGRNELVRLYLYSPASQALAAASEAFPIMELSGELDPHPLMKPVCLSSPQGPASAGAVNLSATAAISVPALIAVMVGVAVRRRRKGKR